MNSLSDIFPQISSSYCPISFNFPMTALYCMNKNNKYDLQVQWFLGKLWSWEFSFAVSHMKRYKTICLPLILDSIFMCTYSKLFKHTTITKPWNSGAYSFRVSE